MPNTAPRPVIVALSTGGRVEDVNLYTDLIAAAMHDEGAMIRTGGHEYPVEVLTAPHGRPEATTLTHVESAARGTALADVYRAALLNLDVDEPAQIASMIADLLHYADACGPASAADVIDQATGYYRDDIARSLGIPTTPARTA